MNGLTWKDIKDIIAIEGAIYEAAGNNPAKVVETYPHEEDFYGEILKRFLEIKKEEQK